MNKPVMCFGLPRYNHLSFYENTFRKNFNKNETELKIIENCLKKKFIYNKEKKRIINYNF